MTFLLSWVLFFLYRRIVDRVVKAAAFLAFHCLAGDQVTDVDHVTQFAQFFGCLAALEEAFRLFVQDVQAVPGAGQAVLLRTMPTYASMIWFTSFMLWVISTRSSVEIVPSSFHSGMSVLKS